MLSVLFFILGFVALWKGGEYIVEGASAIARRFSIPEIIIGLTLVSIGTSLPELVVNVIASLKQESTIVFGNIVGSNISNTLLILGLTGIIFPFKLIKLNIKKEIYLYCFIVLTLGLLLFLNQNQSHFILHFYTGLILIAFCLFAIWLFYQQKEGIEAEDTGKSTRLSTSFIYFLAGCLLLPLGGHWVVGSAISLAELIGISKSVISLFAIAIGTSLPELVTSVIAAKKQNSSIALGNILGSNIFNLSLILGVSVLISPIYVPLANQIDFLVLVYSSILLFLFPIILKAKYFNSLIYYILFVSYIIYIGFLFLR